MDDLISKYPRKEHGDMYHCYKHDIMYQKDMSRIVEYGENYFNKYVKYEGSPIAQKLNHARTSLTEKYCETLLDMGIGSGEFIKSSNVKVKGYDINPFGVRWLKDRGLFHDPYVDGIDFDGVTMWDCLEHMPRPTDFLKLIKKGQYLFVTIPIFELIPNIKNKHKLPNEHLYYFSSEGLENYLNDLDMEFVEQTYYEVEAGREDVKTFVFRKN